MSFSKVHSGQCDVTKATLIDIESDLSRGLYSFSVVGLPDKAVEEARDRVGSAIKNSGFDSPKSKNHKVVISLAPADIKKEGPAFDLPIALSYLLSAEEISFDPARKIFLGELSLDGKVRKINGVLSIVQEAKKKGFEEIYVPKENAREATLVKGITIYGVESLAEIIEHLNEKISPDGLDGRKIKKEKEFVISSVAVSPSIDFADVKGQKMAKRALEIAAAGGHNILLFGPPGTGKTMLAKAFAGILPPLSYDDIVETTAIHSVAGILGNEIITTPPFRAPHHTSSYVSVVGGGNTIRPGEITLSHKGVLFLDEFPEFDRRVIESLREPLEEKMIRISRSKGTAIFPADFILIAAMNPCPCGNFGSDKKRCTCTALTISKYQRKISGPILDRIDMWIEVSDPDKKVLRDRTKEESSAEIKKRVFAARKIQQKRSLALKLPRARNAAIPSKNILEATAFENTAHDILDEAAEKLSLSPRAYHRVMRLSRTIADLQGKEKVSKEHVLEALQYRQRKEIM